MRVLVSGANFVNKGAQSMLFTVISEIRNKFENAEIFVLNVEHIPNQDEYNFKSVILGRYSIEIAQGGIKGMKACLIASVKCLAKIILGYKCKMLDPFEFKQEINNKQFDLLIDISGFSLSSKWNPKAQELYLKTIKYAHEKGMKIFLMPQSFGPFDYKDNEMYLNDIIRKELAYPEIIFAREKEGYDYLVNRFSLKNVVISPDLVLSSKKPEKEKIYVNKVGNKSIEKIPGLLKEKKVGVIPNVRAFENGNQDSILSIYKIIISNLLQSGKTVYVFRHSREDLTACVKIKELFSDNEKVHLLKKDFDCFEYDDFCSGFDFLIASRFHSVVHAYKNSVPCIILGWAVKYNELAKTMSQSQYVFDITSNNVNINSIVTSMKKLEENLKEEKQTLDIRNKYVQTNENCFDILWKYLEDEYSSMD